MKKKENKITHKPRHKNNSKYRFNTGLLINTEVTLMCIFAIHRFVFYTRNVMRSVEEG